MFLYLYWAIVSCQLGLERIYSQVLASAIRQKKPQDYAIISSVNFYLL